MLTTKEPLFGAGWCAWFPALPGRKSSFCRRSTPAANKPFDCELLLHTAPQLRLFPTLPGPEHPRRRRSCIYVSTLPKRGVVTSLLLIRAPQHPPKLAGQLPVSFSFWVLLSLSLLRLLHRRRFGSKRFHGARGTRSREPSGS